VIGLDLDRVRKGKGRIHLTAPGAGSGEARTLCGQTLAAGAYQVVEAEADCSICIRRRRDPAIVSSAYFTGDAGSRLLELSLEQARQRRDERDTARAAAPPATPASTAASAPTPAPPTKAAPAAKPEAPAAAELPARIGELETAGFKKFSDHVYVAPGGAIVRMDGERVVEVVFEGKVQVERTRFGLRVRCGDVVADYSIEGLQANYHIERR
jgi:hypothetical protein